ncbi:restriction endonuclease subunit S [Vibrio scophthalmi]|uniref:restriction endonuclease subunit S n=1 Tax=Vibrio scophthalmi TaxID=45658 RepID=UPI002FEF1DB5
MSELPKGWVNTKLSVVGNTVTGNTPPRKNPEFYGGRVPFVKPGDIDFDKELIQTEETLSDLGSDKARVLRKGSVLVTCIGNIGRVALAMKPMATNQQINSIEFDELILPKFAFYYCRTLSGWLNFNASATTVAIINKSKFSEAPFKLAPLAEQKRIVEKLDEVLAQVDTIKARLDGIPDLLKRFRQSVLASAVSGKLTEEWRGGPSSDFHQSPITVGNEDKASPSGWSWQMLTDLAKLESGHTPRKTVAEYWDDGDVYWICLQDIRAAHGKVIQDTKFKPTMLGIDNSSARLLPAGTVCFSRDISVGFTTIMGKEMSTTQHFANWICGSELSNKYLMYALMAAKRHLTDTGQGTTVKTVYMPALKQFHLLTPPLIEQKEIVRLVEQYFTFADTIEAQVKKAKARVDNLTQSILAKAFRGELVAQDPTDEPADKLLERIAKARAEAEALAKAAKKAESAKKRAAKKATQG